MDNGKRTGGGFGSQEPWGSFAAGGRNPTEMDGNGLGLRDLGELWWKMVFQYNDKMARVRVKATIAVQE
jgi:hypothetical protein